jgi:hypothetical protein
MKWNHVTLPCITSVCMRRWALFMGNLQLTYALLLSACMYKTKYIHYMRSWQTRIMRNITIQTRSHTSRLHTHTHIECHACMHTNILELNCLRSSLLQHHCRRTQLRTRADALSSGRVPTRANTRPALETCLHMQKHVMPSTHEYSH